MHDLLIRNASLADGRTGIDVLVRDGRIADVAPNIDAAATEVVDAAGQLLAPLFVDAHFHMDSTLTYGTPRVNQSGTLLEGIALWGELKPQLAQDAIVDRALAYCDWAVAAAVVPRGVVLTAPVVRVPAETMIAPVNAAKLLLPLPSESVPTPVLVRVPEPWSCALVVAVPAPEPSSTVKRTPVGTSKVPPPVPMLNTYPLPGSAALGMLSL